MNAAQEKERLRNNINREEQREATKDSKVTEQRREKYGKGDSHTDNVNSGGKEGEEENSDKAPKKNEGQKNQQSQLHPETKKEQDVDADGKSHLNRKKA